MAHTVFISSTYIDLIEHRAAVTQALLNAGFHPVDMVHFMARPVDATTACLKEVADSDLFVGIYAWRYGYIPENNDFGITEQEFLEARRLKKLCFCFVIDENHPWPDKKRDTGINKRLLTEFKIRLGKILVHAVFTTPEDLALKVLASLQRWKTEEKNEKTKHKI
ncbi:DUF4062 domain-containing protein [Desulfobacterales bacterium HSG17]|nr:DUF4062 domain-containing protein [Desulfobacterales bacterium HSG17]